VAADLSATSKRATQSLRL